MPSMISRRRRRLARAALVALALPLAGGCGLSGPPKDVISIQQALQDVADALSEVKQTSAALQAQVDSLSQIVAKQDTIIRRLAAGAGVPVP